MMDSVGELVHAQVYTCLLSISLMSCAAFGEGWCQIEEMHRARYGERVWSFHSFCRHATLPVSMCSPTWKLSEPSFWVLWKLHDVDTTDCIIGYCCLDSISRDSPIPTGQGVACEVHILVIWLVLLASSPSPQMFSQSHSIILTEDIFLLKFIYFDGEREREGNILMLEGQGQKGRGQGRIPSKLHTVRAEPNVRFQLLNGEILTWVKIMIWCFTDWATQVPLWWKTTL